MSTLHSLKICSNKWSKIAKLILLLFHYYRVQKFTGNYSSVSYRQHNFLITSSLLSLFVHPPVFHFFFCTFVRWWMKSLIKRQNSIAAIVISFLILTEMRRRTKYDKIFKRDTGDRMVDHQICFSFCMNKLIGTVFFMSRQKASQIFIIHIRLHQKLATSELELVLIANFLSYFSKVFSYFNLCLYVFH